MVKTQAELELERKNLRWGWALFGLFLVLFAGTVGVAFVYLWLAIELRRTMARAAAVRLFHFSLLYLALLFVAMAIDTVVM